MARTWVTRHAKQRIRERFAMTDSQAIFIASVAKELGERNQTDRGVEYEYRGMRWCFSRNEKTLITVIPKQC
jgi:hypothetical protein